MFAIVVPDPSSTTGTVTLSLPSGWTATGVRVTGLAGSGGVGSRFDGSNVVTITFTNAQIDPSTSTIDLTVSGDGTPTPGNVATADEAINGSSQQTATAPVQ